MADKPAVKYPYRVVLMDFATYGYCSELFYKPANTYYLRNLEPVYWNWQADEPPVILICYDPETGHAI